MCAMYCNTNNLGGGGGYLKSRGLVSENINSVFNHPGGRLKTSLSENVSPALMITFHLEIDAGVKFRKTIRFFKINF